MTGSDTPTDGVDPDAPIFADFMDGETAQVHRVAVHAADSAETGQVRIVLPDVDTPIIWQVRDMRRVPDQADRASIVLGLDGPFPARLRITDTALARELAAICPALKRPNSIENPARRLAILAAAAIASVAVIVFVLVPVMADQLARVLPTRGEQALGDSTYEQIRRALGSENQAKLWECDAPDGRAALETMLARLNRGTNFPYDIRLHVLDHDMINAFALPGGHIVLFRGLLADAKSAEEVAAVLGHEMGHVQNRDPTRLTLRSAGSIGVLGLLLGDFAGGAAILFLTERLVQAKYSRKAESTSDIFAHDLLAKAALPTRPMADFFDRLHQQYGTETGLMSHLASHPDLPDRARAALAADTVGDSFVPVLTAGAWRSLRHICDSGDRDRNAQ